MKKTKRTARRGAWILHVGMHQNLDDRLYLHEDKMYSDAIEYIKERLDHAKHIAETQVFGSSSRYTPQASWNTNVKNLEKRLKNRDWLEAIQSWNWIQRELLHNCYVLEIRTVKVWG